MKPKILLLDIETAPIIGYAWGLYDQNISLDQVHTDWHILSWAAKWLDSKEVMYADQSKAKDIKNDKKILKKIWALLNEADIIITQNGQDFDAKKLNARFIMHGFQPPAPYKHIDTLKLAKKRFGFTSNKLAYLTDKLCTKYKKLSHKKFPGFELWKECLAGNKEAWKEMKKYNIHDVLSLEEVYNKLAPWGSGVNFDLYNNKNRPRCNCGGKKLQKRGYQVSSAGKYQRYQCVDCGAWSYDKSNLLSTKKKKLIHRKF